MEISGKMFFLTGGLHCVNRVPDASRVQYPVAGRREMNPWQQQNKGKKPKV
jgi:hypothetical protein